jgi:bifunctional ADP-heptose synthase (sugar kinase/adenylyltransferase)
VHAIDQLTDRLGNGLTLVTLSEHGVVIGDGHEKIFIDAHKREILDVSGAGDTVISVASLCLALGATPELLARISNLAGGLVCEKVGVVPIDAQRLREEALKLVTH